MRETSPSKVAQTLPLWVYGCLLLVLALAGWWIWHEYQALSSPELAPRDAARRLLDLADVVSHLLMGLCALLGLALWLEGRKIWRAERRRSAWAYWLVAVLLLVCGWQLKTILMARLEERLAAALNPGPTDHETFNLE